VIFIEFELMMILVEDCLQFIVLEIGENVFEKIQFLNIINKKIMKGHK